MSNLAFASFKTVLTSKSFKFFTEIALKLKFSILTFFADVWLPHKTNPFLSKWEAICAGPVSFAIISFALFIKDTKVFNFTYSLFSKTTLAFNSLASLISLGPGARRTEYLFLNSCFNFWISSL